MPSFNASSSTLAFGNACLGDVMQRLRTEKRGRMQKIKRFQTAFATHSDPWSCPTGCKDPQIVTQFIKSIRALEELEIRNYEQDINVLWPGIFKQAPSLRRLAIHTPPMFVHGGSNAWTVDNVKRVADELPSLRFLELDVSVEDANAALKSIAPGTILDEVAKMGHLEFICVAIPLLDAKSPFCGDNRQTGFGGSNMPNPNDTVCAALCRKIFNKFYQKDADSSLVELELRLTRRAWEDRGQFDTKKYSYRAVKKDPKTVGSKAKVGAKGKVAVKAEGKAKVKGGSGKGEIKTKGKGKGKAVADDPPAPSPALPRNRRLAVGVKAEGPWVQYMPEPSETPI